jgi:toxin HigB-1
MILSFKDDGTRDVFLGQDTRAARRTCPQEIWRTARRKLSQLDYVSRIADLMEPTGNRLEQLKGDRIGQYSIRINGQYRVCFQ